jgi:hypothetical protein
MATQLSLFSLVVGIALILAGIGFVVLAAGATARTRKTAPTTEVPSSQASPSAS